MPLRELLFADYAALASHSEAGLQHLVDKLSHACREFSLKKTNILAQDAQTPRVITIDNTELEVVDSFTYLGSQCQARWLSACHILGSTNVDADTESRNTNSSTEWSLHSDVFADINKMWGPFHVDLFASRLNFKVSTYASWKPDQGAKYVNAFYMSWKEHYFYAFPPFSVIVACLQKIDQDQATGVLAVPIWQTRYHPAFAVIPLLRGNSDANNQ